MRANIKITLTVKSPHREDHRDTQKLYHKIYLKKDLIKLVAEIYEDDFDVFTLSSSRISSRIYQIFLIFQIFKVSDLYSLSNLRHAFRESPASRHFNQVFNLLKMILLACAASAISEPLLSFPLLKKSKTKMISTMDNNQLHYLMRIKQEDI